MTEIGATTRPAAAVSVPSWKRYTYTTIAAEISSLTRYYDRLIQWARPAGDTGILLESIDAPKKQFLEGDFNLDLRGETTTRTAILLNGTLNVRSDIQQLLQDLRTKLSRTSRVIAVLYNPYYGPLYRAAHRLGLKAGDNPSTFITYADLRNIAKLAGYEIVRVRPAVYSPLRLLGLGTITNWMIGMVPLLRHLALAAIVVLRPIGPESSPPSLSISVPARNESGNIPRIVERIPRLKGTNEIIFVEGHSTDATWEEIERAAANAHPATRVLALRQSGSGKADAVRAGMKAATGDLVVILDADLSVPPEDLALVYDAYCQGHGDFVTGTRLILPMEVTAMQFLNKLGNVFFAKTLTFMLNARITDALCGTKLLARHDLARFEKWRSDFGDFDPFGDFELLFPAALLGLGIVDIPVQYRARTYGSTNIRRFRDGLRLLRMTRLALFRIKAGRT
ncbi:MAG TPA: glycosyltransferase family 2 protein [Thermoanaerobaculia bacterium]